MSKKKEWKDFSFHLFGSTWKVHFVDSIHPYNDEDTTMHFGRCREGDNIITIARKGYGDVTYSDETIRITLFHEIVHAILGTGQYNNTNENEPLVEWVARCFISLNNQNVFSHA